MERDHHLDHLARDGGRMADLARGDLDAEVPTCPEWKLVDLVEHTGFVHRWQTNVVGDDPPAYPDRAAWRHGPADGQSWADWLQAGVDDAARVMGAVDASAPRWTWFPPDQTAGWYFRRITQETLVHRVDAELAATGTATAIDPELAVDGIDEMFDVFLAASDRPSPGWSGETLHLHATDIDGEWLLRMQPEAVSVTRGHAKGDVALRGTAGDVLLYLWNRVDPSALEVFGDISLAQRVQAGFKI